jgi:hypothetical protein
MIIDGDARMIFFHNPKTGGRSFVQSLGYALEERPTRYTHVGPEEAERDLFKAGFKSFWSIAFVRNPWDRLVSLYCYQRSLAYGALFNCDWVHQRARLYDLNDWVRVNVAARVKSNWFGVPQTHWMAGVSEVYRTEDLTTVMPLIAEKTRRPYVASRLNETKRSNVDPLNNYAIDYVAELDQLVVERFGYAHVKVRL